MSKPGTALVVYDSSSDKVMANDDALNERMHTLKDEIVVAKKSMNSALLEEAETIKSTIDTMFARGFQRTWKMGERLKAIDTDTEKFEAGAIPKLAAYLHYSRESLYKRWLG